MLARRTKSILGATVSLASAIVLGYTALHFWMLPPGLQEGSEVGLFKWELTILSVLLFLLCLRILLRRKRPT